MPDRRERLGQQVRALVVQGGLERRAPDPAAPSSAPTDTLFRIEITAAAPAACPSSIVVGTTRADAARPRSVAEIDRLATSRLLTPYGTSARSGMV